jgi:hypothetical protein
VNGDKGIGPRKSRVMKTSLLLSVLLSIPWINAAVISIDRVDFPVTATTLTLSSLPDGTEVNGLTTGGVTFGYSLGDGNVEIGSGPGETNNVNPPLIVATGDPSGDLTLLLPGYYTMFGYGFVLLFDSDLADATRITLFDGSTSVGTLSYDAEVDPLFAGGFAGIQSTIPFNIIVLTFDSTSAQSFALDNLMLASDIPEPTSFLFVAAGVLGILGGRAANRKGSLLKSFRGIFGSGN